jgi:hypothetical protein
MVFSFASGLRQKAEFSFDTGLDNSIMTAGGGVYRM